MSCWLGADAEAFYLPNCGRTDPADTLSGLMHRGTEEHFLEFSLPFHPTDDMYLDREIT